MSYQSIRTETGVIQKFSGFLGWDEYQSALTAILNDPNFELIKYVISDFSAVTETDLTVKDTVYVAALSKGATFTNKDVRVAVIATHPDILQLVDLYKSAPYASYPTAVFSTVSDAKTWLQAELATKDIR